MVKILREADQLPVAEVAKKHGISDVTIYAWRKRFGQLEPADVERMRQLEQENRYGRKLIARLTATKQVAGLKTNIVLEETNNISAFRFSARPASAKGPAECRRTSTK